MAPPVAEAEAVAICEAAIRTSCAIISVGIAVLRCCSTTH
eukprot:COSAG06_NODE_45951_length_350_cov_1269.015936_1_plen_39_part_01